ncbi:glycosyltransferase family A protein [Chloroflexota bacterium]
MTKPIINVCIFTRNPHTDNFKKVARALSFQTLSLQEWELIIIDNKSEEPVKAHFERDFSWHPNVKFVIEPSIGFQYVHRRAVLESQADWIILLADDCVLSTEYLKSAIKLIKKHPEVGVFSGLITYQFPNEVNFLNKSIYEATYTRRSIEGYFETSEKSRWTFAHAGSAGLVFHSDIGKAYLKGFWKYEEIVKYIKRNGQNVSLRVTDLDLPMYALYLNYKIAASDELMMDHIIEKNDLHIVRMMKLAYQMGFFLELFRFRWNWRPYPVGFSKELYKFSKKILKPQRNPIKWITRIINMLGQIHAMYFLSKNPELINRIPRPGALSNKIG